MPLGFFIGTFGTLIGAGGGFILMPILLLVYPQASPETVTSISLAVVFFNAFSGSFAYARMKRIDYKSGLLFGLATIPGALLGAITTAYIPRQLFNAVFGFLLIAASSFLFLRSKRDKLTNQVTPNHHLKRNLVEADGTAHAFSYNPATGIVLSILVGYLSSLLGIGGGVIHVPALVYLLDFPIHIATATSHFILTAMALTGTLVHIATGAFAHGVWQTIFLAVGVVFGAQLGAKLSGRIHGIWIMRSLAVALGLIGIRILIMAW